MKQWKGKIESVMMYWLFFIIIIISSIEHIIYTSKRVKEALSICDQIEKINSKRIYGIRLYNYQGEKKSVFVACIISVLTCIFLFVLCYITMDIGLGAILSCSMCILVILSVIEIGIAILVYRHLDDCFLTYDGIVSLPILYDKSDCDFATRIENLNGNSKRLFIDVYLPGSTSLHKFGVTERQEEAVEIVNKFKG